MKIFTLLAATCLIAACSANKNVVTTQSRASLTTTTTEKYTGNQQSAPNVTRVLRASQQRIIPGATSRNKPYTEYRMQIVWREPKEPNQLLYRSNTDQWIHCTIKKKVGRDTLYLYGKEPVTYQVKISNPVSNALYFNNQQGDWQYIPAKGLRVLKDVKMH